MGSAKNDVSGYIDESNKIDDPIYPAGNPGSNKAWKWLMEQPEVTKEVICELQKQIVAHQTDLFDDERGAYRRMDVWIGGRKGAEPFMVPHMMSNWVMDYQNKTPKEAHVWFEKIHPFIDGNGRTGRMLMWRQEIERGELPTLIEKAHVRTYYKWFKED